MIKCTTQGCCAELPYSGRGRRPKRCAMHQKAAERGRRLRGITRDRSHRDGKPVTKWGPYLTISPSGRIVRRDRALVWGPLSDADGQVVSAGGVFTPIGAHGVWGEDDGLLQLAARSEPAKEWLDDNAEWWRMNDWAHGVFSRDQADEVIANAQHIQERPTVPYRLPSGIRRHRVFVVHSDGVVVGEEAYYEQWARQNNKGGRA